jgi:hypothetical protein
MINELKMELTETTKLIKEYNGLRKSQNDFEGRLKTIENCLESKDENKKEVQWLLGWLVGLAAFIYGLLK